MVEPIGLASGVVALTTFAFQSSIALYKTIKSYQSVPKRVRDLVEELETLKEVLGGLGETIRISSAATFAGLEHPLLRCGNACRDFENEIQKLSFRSSAGKSSFRDWAKLKYMDEDLDGFRRMLAGYKSTIVVALTDANLRQSSIAVDSIESYKEMIETTTDDLQAHLESIDEKLERVIARSTDASTPDADNIKLMEEERISTRKCLEICAQLSRHIEQIQEFQVSCDDPSASVSSNNLPEKLMNDGLQECRESLFNAATKLEIHLKTLMDRIVAKSKSSITSQEDVADLIRLQEEWETTRQSMHICSKAGTRLGANVSSVDNYATGDAVQFLVSTSEKTIHGRNRGLGWRTRQVGGHLSDASVQQLSKDMVQMNVTDLDYRTSPSDGNNTPVQDEEIESQSLSGFKERYGEGFKLKAAHSASRFSPTTPLK
ncbi:hypothetical protein N7495_009380 [Penicillium taxi]|uniref:uncharacterized protein n=1 Tax=Penicillium taxi TaxID=168475 RepID=UPI002544D70E|nr:uncharacterized protein N7495_009380 [Penicillium taxi]KAJ5884870.1 hypothetical protein N7495_009380 [Penicillium taxi]